MRKDPSFSHNDEEASSAKQLSRGEIFKKIRDIERLLDFKKDALPDDVKAAHRKRIESLQKLLVKKRNRKFAKLIDIRKKLYQKIRFFERQKVKRKLRQVRAELASLIRANDEAKSGEPLREGSGNAASSPGDVERMVELRRQLQKLTDDLEYIENYPDDKPYISLFSSSVAK